MTKVIRSEVDKLTSIDADYLDDPNVPDWPPVPDVECAEPLYAENA